jgi:hypothetical protein
MVDFLNDIDLKEFGTADATLKRALKEYSHDEDVDYDSDEDEDWS